MTIVLTAKLKQHTTPEQFRSLRQTQLADREALNAVSRDACAHGKMSNKVGLQDGTYQQIRALRLARANGVRSPSAGGRHLHDRVDEGEGERRRPCSWSHQEALSRTRPAPQVGLAHADLPTRA
jgi:hypothetical protein